MYFRKKNPSDMRDVVLRDPHHPVISKILLAELILRKLMIPDMALIFCFFNHSNTRYSGGCNLREKQLNIRSPSLRPHGHHT